VSRIKIKDDKRDKRAGFGFGPENTPPELGFILSDTFTGEPLRCAAKVPIVIDDGVSRVIDKPSGTVSVCVLC